ALRKRAFGLFMSFTIAIIGRPNVGKSTLFNRLVGQKLALVDDEPGVTRDRREGSARLGDLEFTVIDTAGLDEGAKGSLTARMQEQTETAISLADALMFVIDARAALTPAPVEEGEAFDDDDIIVSDEELAQRPIRVAIVGRPNAGKSTLINHLLGEERLLTSAEAGTTRDSISVEIIWQGREFRVFDTAGLRR